MKICNPMFQNFLVLVYLMTFLFQIRESDSCSKLSTIDATEFQNCFYLCNGLKNQANSCYCWKSKV